MPFFLLFSVTQLSDCIENEVARAEAMMIANTDNQYLVPTSGKPLRGLIQDHVVAGVAMTSQDSFFTREEYFQLLYGALRPEDYGGRLVTLSPAVWKPKPLWTGKQIVRFACFTFYSRLITHP
jgi:DNA-directed RNA polymerase beta' subunit